MPAPPQRETREGFPENKVFVLLHIESSTITPVMGKGQTNDCLQNFFSLPPIPQRDWRESDFKKVSCSCSMPVTPSPGLQHDYTSSIPKSGGTVWKQMKAESIKLSSLVSFRQIEQLWSCHFSLVTISLRNGIAYPNRVTKPGLPVKTPDHASSS